MSKTSKIIIFKLICNFTSRENKENTPSPSSEFLSINVELDGNNKSKSFKQEPIASIKDFDKISAIFRKFYNYQKLRLKLWYHTSEDLIELCLWVMSS